MTVRRAVLSLVPTALLLTACAGDPVSAPAAAPSLAVSSKVTTRPVADFLVANRGCTLAWVDQGDPNTFRVVADLWASQQWLSPVKLAASTFDGSVSVRPLADGRAEVTAKVHGRDVLTYATRAGQLVFGYSRGEVNAGAAPVLGDANFSTTFVIASPAAPLPSMCVLTSDPSYELSKAQLTVSAAGPLRAAFGVDEGTPGRLNMVQTGRYLLPGNGNGVADFFPAEHIVIRPTGN